MRYDLHTHTKYSKCSNLEPKILLKLAKKYGLDGIAVTDHDSINGSLAVKKINKDKDFEVIIGSELHCDLGSILGFFLNKDIKKKTIPEIIDEIKKQGGLSAIAHPYRISINDKHKFRYPIEKIKNKIDAIEAFNSRCFPWENKKAVQTADKYKISKIAGSDAHFKFEVGKGYTEFDGDLAKAIRQNKTTLHGTTIQGSIGGLLSFLRNNLL